MVSFSRNLVVKSLADTETKIQTETTETSRPIENPRGGRPPDPPLPAYGIYLLLSGKECLASSLICMKQVYSKTIIITNALTEVIVVGVLKLGVPKSPNLSNLGSFCRYVGQGSPPQIWGLNSPLWGRYEFFKF